MSQLMCQWGCDKPAEFRMIRTDYCTLHNPYGTVRPGMEPRMNVCYEHRMRLAEFWRTETAIETGGSIQKGEL